ncbi:ATP-binding protein, partial [Salmonella enterica]|uniref:ATP-binding protein n=2 Tax=Bacteria TaxID=2 RepID=UPI0020C4C8A1
LLDAMKYGSKSSLYSRDRNDLGRFGLGLKMASFSQCRKLTVVSKKSGQVNAYQWNLDVISEQQKWMCRVLNPMDIENLPLNY